MSVKKWYDKAYLNNPTRRLMLLSLACTHYGNKIRESLKNVYAEGNVKPWLCYNNNDPECSFFFFRFVCSIVHPDKKPNLNGFFFFSITNNQFTENRFFFFFEVYQSLLSVLTHYKWNYSFNVYAILKLPVYNSVKYVQIFFFFFFINQVYVCKLGPNYFQ